MTVLQEPEVHRKAFTLTLPDPALLVPWVLYGGKRSQCSTLKSNFNIANLF